MNPLLSTYLNCVRKIKILHSLPGRLRVNVYGVRQFPEIAQQYAPKLQQKMVAMHGVKSASLCTVTGNLLIVYETQQITEAELMLWLNEAWLKLSDVLKWLDVNKIEDDKQIADVLERMLDQL